MNQSETPNIIIKGTSVNKGMVAMVKALKKQLFQESMFSWEVWSGLFFNSPDKLQTELLCFRYLVYGSFYLIGYSLVVLVLHITLLLWIPVTMANLNNKGLCAIIVSLVSKNSLNVFSFRTLVVEIWNKTKTIPFTTISLRHSLEDPLDCHSPEQHSQLPRTRSSRRYPRNQLLLQQVHSRRYTRFLSNEDTFCPVTSLSRKLAMVTNSLCCRVLQTPLISGLEHNKPQKNTWQAEKEYKLFRCFRCQNLDSSAVHIHLRCAVCSDVALHCDVCDAPVCNFSRGVRWTSQRHQLPPRHHSAIRQPHVGVSRVLDARQGVLVVPYFPETVHKNDDRFTHHQWHVHVHGLRESHREFLAPSYLHFALLCSNRLARSSWANETRIRRLEPSNNSSCYFKSTRLDESVRQSDYQCSLTNTGASGIYLHWRMNNASETKEQRHLRFFSRSIPSFYSWTKNWKDVFAIFGRKK